MRSSKNRKSTQYAYRRQQDEDDVSDTRSSSHIQKFYSFDDAARARRFATIARASKCCPCPLPCGSPCGTCMACIQILKCITQRDGLNDAWCAMFRDHCARLRCADLAFIYDFVTPPIIPGQPGAIYTPGVSQVLIFHPAPTSTTSAIFGAFPTMTVITLTTPTGTDFPTPTSLAPGDFGVYFPYGTGINNTTPLGTLFALSGITFPELSVVSVSYIPPAQPPVLLMNTMWEVSSQDANGNKILRPVSIAMYQLGWELEITRLMDSSVFASSLAGPSVVKIVGLNVAAPFWDLERTTIAFYACVKDIFIKAIFPERQILCFSCQSGRGSGCQGEKCGKKLGAFSFSPSCHIVSDERDDAFHNLPSEIKMLEDVLYNRSLEYNGLTIHDESKTIVKSQVGDNLAFCSHEDLKAALKQAKKTAVEVEILDASSMNSEEIGIHALRTSEKQRAQWMQTLTKYRKLKSEIENQKLANVRAATTPITVFVDTTPVVPVPSSPKPAVVVGGQVRREPVVTIASPQTTRPISVAPTAKQPTSAAVKNMLAEYQIGMSTALNKVDTKSPAINSIFTGDLFTGSITPGNPDLN